MTTLDDFFNLLDIVALDRHWKHRRAFWKAYLDKGVIDNAWMVLGTDSRQQLDTESETLQAYGCFTNEKHVESNHSVLMMDIQGLVIADWSHNGSCRLWKSGNRSAPGLYKEKYEAAHLRNKDADHRQPHSYSEYGTWQRKVVEWIRREIGISVDRQRYLDVR